jgi:AbrB family looped-hinge helix DNA binding protein
MTTLVKVEKNRRIALPREFSDKFGIAEGSILGLEYENRTVKLHKVPEFSELAGVWGEEMDEVMDKVRKRWKEWK